MANAYPLADPVAISRNTTNSLGVEMADLRRGLSGLIQPMYGAASGAISGVLPDGISGSGFGNGLQYTQTSGLTGSVNAGNYAFDRGSGNTYLGMAYSSFNLTHDQGDAVNPRVDCVIIRHRDPGLSGETTTTQSAFPVILKGTPAATPQKPTSQVTSTDLLIASVTVGGGSNANNILAITDERLQITARGGIYQAATWDTRPGAYEGQYRDNLANNNLERWSGTVWQPVASPAVWTQITPRLIADGTKLDANIGTGATKLCRYQLLGKTLRFQYFFKWGTPPFNAGYGNLYTLLPAGLVAATTDFSWWNTAHLWINNQNGVVADYGGWSFIRGGQNILTPSFPVSNDLSSCAFYRVAAQQGTSGQGVPQVTGYPEGGELAMSGTIEVQ